ncbi:MAG: TIGR01777 family oxidoreductase [Desulfotalea sp.]
MRILLSGASGLVGSNVLQRLFDDGHEISCLKRGGKKSTIWNTELLNNSSFDAVIHLAGDNIASSRWTKKKKETIYNSRIHGTREIIRYLQGTNNPPKTFICASAVGYFGDRGDELLTEDKSRGRGFLANICHNWEKEATKIAGGANNTRVVNLRFGMIISAEGGAIGKMLPPFKKGLGGNLGSGKQYLSWVSIDDVVNIVAYALKNDAISGPINAVSPIPTTNGELTKELCKAIGKRPFLPLPEIIVKIAFGKEMAEEMLLSSCRATPEKLTMAGYEFIDVNLSSTLKKYLA